MKLKLWLINTLILFTMGSMTSVKASAEQVFAYCKASVGPSDTFYFSRVYQFDSKAAEGGVAPRLQLDSYAFDNFLSANHEMKGTPSGFCVSAKSRAAATEELNHDAAWYKEARIKFVFTNWVSE